MTHHVDLFTLRDGRVTYSFVRTDGTRWVSPKSWSSKARLRHALKQSGMVLRG